MQFMLWQESRYSDLSTHSYTSTCEIPTLKYYPTPEKGNPFGLNLSILAILGSSLPP